MDKKFTGKPGKNADDVTSNPRSGVSVRRRCPLTGVRSFIFHMGHRTRVSCAFTDIPRYLQYSGRKLYYAQL